MELVETFQPYIIENLDYMAVYFARAEAFPLPPANNPERILEVYQTQEFRNIATQKWVIVSDLLEQYQSNQERIQNIIKILEAELAKD